MSYLKGTDRFNFEPRNVTKTQNIEHIGDRIPVESVFFCSRPDRPCGPPSLLYNWYRVFPGGKVGRGVLLNTHPLLVPRSWKSRAIPLPTLWVTTGPVTGTLYLYLNME